MQTATLEQVRQHAIDHSRNHTDEIVSSKSLLMDPQQPGRIIIRRPGSSQERSFAFHKRVYRQAPLVVVGIPGGYLEKLIESDKGDPTLASLNFNHWVGVGDDKGALLRFGEIEVTGNDGKKKTEIGIRAFLPQAWNPVPYHKTLEALIAKFTPEREVNYDITENAIKVELITRKLEYDKETIHNFLHDPVQFGFALEDSDVGALPINVGPYMLRLHCTNGAMTREKGISVTIRHSGKESDSVELVMSSVRQAIEVMDGYSAFYADRLTKTKTMNLELDGETNMPEIAINRLRKEMLVNKLEEKYVREAWNVEGESIPEPSLYRLFNAVTRAGTHGEELDDLSKMKMQAVGGRIISGINERQVSWN